MCLTTQHGLPVALEIPFVYSNLSGFWTKDETTMISKNTGYSWWGCCAHALLFLRGQGCTFSLASMQNMQQLCSGTYAQRKIHFSWLCFRFNTFSSCLLAISLLRLMGRQESSCRQSALQLLLAGSGRRATAVV